jgi:hypothetical protein
MLPRWYKSTVVTARENTERKKKLKFSREALTRVEEQAPHW